MPLADEPIAGEDIGGEFEQPGEIELGLVVMGADECGIVGDDVLEAGVLLWSTKVIVGFAVLT